MDTLKTKLLRGTHSFYGKVNDQGFTTFIPTVMGIGCQHYDSLIEATKALREFENNKENIIKLRKLTDEYCLKNPWTRSGT